MTNAKLYRKTKSGGISEWSIIGYILDGIATIEIAHSVVIGGSQVKHFERITQGLGGRTLNEQMISRIESRISRQRDKGYVSDYNEALNMPLANTLGLPPPMLAKKYADLRGFQRFIGQPKLDGFRCLAAKEDGVLTIYSRQGKVLSALHHLDEALRYAIPDGTILDGEIYSHGVNLQTIASLAKRHQPGTEKLVYNVYDCISSQPFEHRYADAADVVQAANDPRVVMVPNSVVTTTDEMWSLFAQYRREGYEGLMLRNPQMGYESGHRSIGLIKVKAREDGEFEITDIIAGEDGCGILVCKAANGRLFKTLAPGTHSEKRTVLAQKNQYIGRLVTCEYANLTSDGIPFHCVATRFREEI